MDRYRVLHSLNAARVCAEYCVVHYHVAPGGGFLKNDKMASALMSFFFVLSGFMAMHTNMDTDFSVAGAKWDYVSRRLQRTYPTYLIWILIDMPGNLMQHWQLANECPLFWVALASQPVLLQAWLGCFHTGASNGVGWYLCTLFWLWFMFPFLPTRRLFSSWPRVKIACLYCASVLGFVAFSGLHPSNTRALPILRAGEFLMGCCAALTLDTPVSGWLALLAVLGFAAFCGVSHALPWLWRFQDAQDVCRFWPTHKPEIDPTTLLSLFSPAWCVLIQWLAATELSGGGGPVMSALQWGFFRSLSGFSLQLYLSHSVVGDGLRHLAAVLGLADWWSADTLILSLYLLAYLYSTQEQAALGWAGASARRAWRWLRPAPAPLEACV